MDYPKVGFLAWALIQHLRCLVCSLMEGVVFQHISEIRKLLSYSTSSLKVARIVGGASKSEGWAQIFSDCFGTSCRKLSK